MSTTSIAMPVNSASMLTNTSGIPHTMPKSAERAGETAPTELPESKTVESRPEAQSAAAISAQEETARRAATQEGKGPMASEPDALSRDSLHRLMEKVQKTVRAINSQLEFRVDEDTNKLVIKIIDTSTKEIIKQIPPQELIEIAKALDKLKGLLVREQA